nr:retrotransposon Orf1 [Tanacetum cinerariifolium]
MEADLAPKSSVQGTKSLLNARSVVVPTTLNIAWKIACKLLSITHPHVYTKRKASDFMIVKDISLIIDPRVSQVVLGKHFVEISNMTHDLSLIVVKFTNETNEVTYKIPHKIEQHNSLLDLEKSHTKSVYFRNEEDRRRGVDYLMSKILGFYKECLGLGPKHMTGLEDEGGVT